MHEELGGHVDPGSPGGDTIPQGECPGVCGERGDGDLYEARRDEGDNKGRDRGNE